MVLKYPSYFLGRSDFMKKCMCLVLTTGMGILLYTQIKNGNMKKLIEKCKNTELKVVSKLENMM